MAIEKWTEAEKLSFIASLMFHNTPSPSMKGMKLPEGRTPKACRHVLDKFKQMYYRKDDNTGDSELAEDHFGGEGGAVTPVSASKFIKTATPRKRKAEGGPKRGSKKSKVDEEEDDVQTDLAIRAKVKEEPEKEEEFV